MQIPVINASVVALVLANLIPLVGVLFWNWSVFEVVVLYWLENVIIGGINILKMLTCAPDPERSDLQGSLQRRGEERGWKPDGEEAEKAREFGKLIETHRDKLRLLNHGSKLFFIPVFAVHYGFFCLIHGSHPPAANPRGFLRTRSWLRRSLFRWNDGGALATPGWHAPTSERRCQDVSRELSFQHDNFNSRTPGRPYCGN